MERERRAAEQAAKEAREQAELEARLEAEARAAEEERLRQLEEVAPPPQRALPFRVSRGGGSPVRALTHLIDFFFIYCQARLAREQAISAAKAAEDLRVAKELEAQAALAAAEAAKVRAEDMQMAQEERERAEEAARAALQGKAPETLVLVAPWVARGPSDLTLSARSPPASDGGGHPGAPKGGGNSRSARGRG